MSEETKELKMWCIQQALGTSGNMITDENENTYYPNNSQLIELAMKIYNFLKEDGHTNVD